MLSVMRRDRIATLVDSIFLNVKAVLNYITFSTCAEERKKSVCVCVSR